MALAAADCVLKGDVVLPDRVVRGGYVAIAGGKIAAAGEGDPPPAKPSRITAAACCFRVW